MKGLPKVVFVKREDMGNNTTGLLADESEDALVELEPAAIGEYRLVKIRKRKLMATDA